MNTSEHVVPGAPAAALPDADAVYVYAFVEGSFVGELRAGPGPGRPPALHRVGSISAIVCAVPVGEFQGADAERRLADPLWVVPRACHHEAVVEDAMRRSPVFPTGFATLYASLDSLTDFMRRHEADISRFLRRVTGQQEWALKITADLDDAKLLDALAMELRPGWPQSSPGTRYLRLRQERPVLIDLAWGRALQRMARIIDALRPHTSDIRELRRSQAARGGARTADHALLVPAGNRAALDEKVAELAAELEPERLRLVLSGPWPPYSFRPALGVLPSPSSMS